MTGVLTRRGEGHRHRGKKAIRRGQRLEPEDAGSHQELEEARNDSLLQALEKQGPAKALILDFWPPEL